MRTAQAVGNIPPRRGHGRHGVRHAGRTLRAPRAIAPEGLALFSDRLDDARDVECIVRDFAVVHDRTLTADDDNS